MHTGQCNLSLQPTATMYSELHWYPNDTWRMSISPRRKCSQSPSLFPLPLMLVCVFFLASAVSLSYYLWCSVVLPASNLFDIISFLWWYYQLQPCFFCTQPRQWTNLAPTARLVHCRCATKRFQLFKLQASQISWIVRKTHGCAKHVLFYSLIDCFGAFFIFVLLTVIAKWIICWFNLKIDESSKNSKSRTSSCDRLQLIY